MGRIKVFRKKSLKIVILRNTICLLNLYLLKANMPSCLKEKVDILSVFKVQA